MILTDQNIGGKMRNVLTHFDRNGFGYTLDRATGELLVAEKFDPVVNWATKVDMDKSSKTYGRPLVVDAYSTQHQGEDTNSKGICPAALGTKDEQPAAYSPETQLFYVPTNHVCMDYEPYKVAYTAGQAYVGAAVAMYPPKGDTNMGNFIAWDGKTGKIVWSNKEQFSAWGGALATAGGVVFYGTLEGYLKAVDAKTGKELYKFKTPSGIIGNVMTYEHGGKQYVAVLSGVGGWAGIGLAAGLLQPENAAAWHGAVDQGKLPTKEKTVDTAGLGAVGGYAGLASYTSLGGTLTVFALPQPNRRDGTAQMTLDRRAAVLLRADCFSIGMPEEACVSINHWKFAARRRWRVRCRRNCLRGRIGQSGRGVIRQRQVCRQGRQPDLQDQSRTAPSTGTLSPAFAAIIRTAMSATVPTARDRAMRRRWLIR